MGVELEPALASDQPFMAVAIEQARLAAQVGEVPVGAVLVMESAIVAAAHNAPISANDPTAHAEVRVIRTASAEVGNYRLPGSTLYVTLEPCSMCVGALMHARIERLVFGAREPKAGSVVSACELLSAPHFNHRIEVTEGVQAEICSALLSEFFAERRAGEGRGRG